MAVIKAINPSKRSLSRGINYITNPEKTDENLISGKDCDAQTVLDEMKATKELYDKTDGRQYKHYIQSFKPDDPLTPEQAHQIGYEMAQKAFPGFEVLVATHTDKDHLHNHFIVNSVSFESGKKYWQSTKDLQEIKDLSDQICKREGLHVMTKEEQIPGKALSMNEHQVANKGESLKFRLISEIDKSIKTSHSKEEFIKSMEAKGYQVKWVDTRKSITYTTPQIGEKPGTKFRDNKLHDIKYLKEAMEIGFGRIKEKELQPDQPGRSTAGQRDQGTDILFRDQVHSKRADQSHRTNSAQDGTRREDQTGVRDETPREREGQGRAEGETQRNSQLFEARNQRNEGSEFQKNGDDLRSGKRGNAKESGDLQQVHSTDPRTSVSSKKYTKSELEGKVETVRSQSSDFSWDNSLSIGCVSGSDHIDEMIETLGDPKAEGEAVRNKTQTAKNHQKKAERER